MTTDLGLQAHSCLAALAQDLSVFRAQPSSVAKCPKLGIRRFGRLGFAPMDIFRGERKTSWSVLSKWTGMGWTLMLWSGMRLLVGDPGRFVHGTGASCLVAVPFFALLNFITHPFDLFTCIGRYAIGSQSSCSTPAGADPAYPPARPTTGAPYLEVTEGGGDYGAGGAVGKRCAKGPRVMSLRARQKSSLWAHINICRMFVSVFHQRCTEQRWHHPPTKSRCTSVSAQATGMVLSCNAIPSFFKGTLLTTCSVWVLPVLCASRVVGFIFTRNLPSSRKGYLQQVCCPMHNSHLLAEVAHSQQAGGNGTASKMHTSTMATSCTRVCGSAAGVFLFVLIVPPLLGTAFLFCQSCFFLGCCAVLVLAVSLRRFGVFLLQVMPWTGPLGLFLCLSLVSAFVPSWHTLLPKAVFLQTVACVWGGGPAKGGRLFFVALPTAVTLSITWGSRTGERAHFGGQEAGQPEPPTAKVQCRCLVSENGQVRKQKVSVRYKWQTEFSGPRQKKFFGGVLLLCIRI